MSFMSVYTKIGDVLPMILLFLIMAFLLKIAHFGLTRKKGNIWIEFKVTVYIIYAFLLFHMVTTTDFISYSNNFIPFKEILRYKFTDQLFFHNVIGNIAVFIPFGYLITDAIYILSKKDKFYISLIYVVITSLSIETIQLFIGRTFDIDDIILNTLGGLIGIIIYKLIHLIIRRKR